MDVEALVQQLRRDGVVQGDSPRLEPLPGGVSSEIYRVRDGERTFVVKRALEKLKVAAEWRANTDRNDFERDYFAYVGTFLPEAVPHIEPTRGEGYFVMEYLGGFANWKEELLAGRFDEEIARKAGEVLGTLHARTAGEEDASRRFDTTENFEELRIAPYLRTTGERHEALRTHFEAEARSLRTHRECLVHGDFSPKNLLHKDGRLVALDAEVAWYGDPAFDLAFFLNHLHLKALYHAPAPTPLRAMIDAAVSAYRQARGLDPDSERAVEGRSARLLLLLMLARVDGKSPVEYLQEDKQKFVRAFVRPRLTTGGQSLGGVVAAWFGALEKEFPSKQSK